MKSWHWQNLNEQGSGLFYGRGWFRPFGYERPSINLEWCFAGKARSTHAYIALGDEESGVKFALAISHLFSIWLTFADLFPYRWFKGEERRTGISWYEGTLSLEIWHDGMGASHFGEYRDIWKHPGDRRWHVTPMDVIFGRFKYEERILEVVTVSIPMPEKLYTGTCKIFTSTWTRPRLPWFPRRMKRTTIDVPGGIPFPGKGENSWDCGDDACFGLTCGAQTSSAAVGEIVKSVLRSREKNGGRKWLPPVTQEAV